MPGLTEFEVETLREWLNRHQFDHVSRIGDDSTPFGNRQDVWERDGTLVRMTQDRGQWFYDLSRSGTGVWLDIDAVAGAMGFKSTAPVERVADVASIDDRVFEALCTEVRHTP